VAAVPLVLVAAYVAAYFLLSTPVSSISNAGGSSPDVEHLTRFYDHAWLRTIFAPASHIEAWIRGIDVNTASMDGGPVMAHPQ